MKRIFVSVLIVLFIANNVMSQVSIKILDFPKKIKLCQKEICFKVEIENKTEVNYLFYGLSYIEPNEEEFKCLDDSLSTSRSWIQFIDENGIIIEHSPITETYPARVDLTKKRIDFFEKFHSDTLIVNSNSKLIKEIKMPTEDVILREGKYKVKVGLISGKYISEILDEKIFREDETRTNSKLFFGCCESDFFEIIVVK